MSKMLEMSVRKCLEWTSAAYLTIIDLKSSARRSRYILSTKGTSSSSRPSAVTGGNSGGGPDDGERKAVAEWSLGWALSRLGFMMEAALLLLLAGCLPPVSEVARRDLGLLVTVTRSQLEQADDDEVDGGGPCGVQMRFTDGEISLTMICSSASGQWRW